MGQDEPDRRAGVAKAKVHLVCAAAAFALEHEAEAASLVLEELSDDCYEAALILFAGVLAVVKRSAQLLEVDPVEYARGLASYYVLGSD